MLQHVLIKKFTFCERWGLHPPLSALDRGHELILGKPNEKASALDPISTLFCSHAIACYEGLNGQVRLARRPLDVQFCEDSHEANPR